MIPNGGVFDSKGNPLQQEALNLHSPAPASWYPAEAHAVSFYHSVSSFFLSHSGNFEWVSPG